MAQQSTTNTIRELWELLRSYARQETVDPFKALGRSLAWGFAGAILLSVGASFLALAALRALQNETDAFADNLSWLPYLIVAAGLALIAALAAFGISRATRHRAREERT